MPHPDPNFSAIFPPSWKTCTVEQEPKTTKTTPENGLLRYDAFPGSAEISIVRKKYRPLASIHTASVHIDSRIAKNARLEILDSGRNLSQGVLPTAHFRNRNELIFHARKSRVLHPCRGCLCGFLADPFE